MAKRSYYHKKYQKNQTISNLRRSAAATSRASGHREAPIWQRPRLWVLALLCCSALLMASRQLALPLVQEVSDALGLYDEGKAAAVTTAVTGETQLHFIDVGQGDATLIAQSGEYALIDAGFADATEDLLAYLQSLEIETIQVLVMTHPHADHIGAMDEIIDTFAIETVILPDFNWIEELPTTTSFTNVLSALERSDATVVTAQVGECYAVGEGSLTIVSTGVQTDNLNDISVSTLFTAGEFSLLCTGDAEAAQEEAMLASGVNLQATVFQAGHHGSYTSNTLAFLQAVQPELVVISCGVDNSYGHPNAAALENFDAVGATYYRTDLKGNVVVRYTAAEGISVLCETEVAA